MDDLFLLSERQMSRIEAYFPLSHGVPRVDDRRVVSGIVYVIRNGLQWKDAPKGYDVSDYRLRERDAIAQHIEAVVGSDHGLAVEPQQVVLVESESADGHFGMDAAMGSMPVVVVEPARQFLGSAI